MSSQGRYSILVEVQTGNAVSQINQLKGSLSSLNTVGQPLGQAAASLDKLTTSAASSQASLQRLVGVTGPLGNNFSNAASRAGQLSGALGNVGSSASKVAGGLNQTNTLSNQAAGSMGKLATAADKAGKSSMGMAQNLRGMIIPIVGMGSAIVEAVGMFQAFQDVSKNVADAQKKVNDAVKRYGADSREAEQATKQLTDAQRGLSFMMRNTIQSFSDIGIFAALMANSFLKMRSSAAALTPALTAATTQTGALNTAMVATNAASTGAVGGISRFTAVLRGIPAALGPIGIILAVVGTAIAAFTALYSQNIGGLRDTTNDFGRAVGEAIPILRPFGDALMGIAGQLGITGESAEQTAQHFRNATTGFQEMGTLWEQTAQQITDAFMEWGAAVQEGAALVGEGIASLFSDIESQVGQWLGEFGSLVQSGFENTFGPLVDMASQVAADIGEALSNVGQFITDAGISTLEALGIDGNALVSQAQSVAQQIGAAFSGVKQSIDEALKASQQPGAGGNVPGAAESIQPAPFTGQTGTLEYQAAQQGRRIIPQGGTFTRKNIFAQEAGFGQPGQQQTVQDLGIAPQNINRLPTTGAAELDAISKGYRVLTPEVTKYQQQLDKQAAIDKIVRQGLDSQKTGADQAGVAYDELTRTYGEAGFMALDLKASEEQLLEQFALNDVALVNLKAAQDAISQGRKQGKTDAEIQKDVEAALAGEIERGTKKAQDHETVIQKLRKSNDDLGLSLAETSQAIQDQSFMHEMSKQGTLEAQQAIVGYGAELLKNTAFNKEWGAAIDSNVFKQAAFATGVQNQVAAMQQAKVEVLENAGALAQYATQIASGESLQIAFTQGVQAVDQAFLESVDSIARTQGEMLRYNQLLAEGKIQSVEFAKGQQEMVQSFQHMDASMANIEGQISAFDQLLKSGDVSLKAWNLGLREGQLAARNWFTEMQQGSGHILGLEQGLRELAGTLGVELPANIQLTAEQMQQLIAVSQGGVEAIRALEGSLAEMGNALTESLVVGFDDMDDALDDKLDEMEDKFEETFGVDMPETVRNALEQSGIEESFGAVAEEGLANMSAVFSDPTAFQDMGQTLIESLEGQMSELSPRMQGIAQEVIDNIKAVLDDPSNAELWTNLTQSVEAFQTAVNTVDLASPFDTGREAAVKYSQEIDNIVSKITQLNPQLAGFETDLAGLAANAPGTVAPLTKPQEPTAPAAPDTAALDGMLTKLQTVQQALTLLGPATVQAVGQMSAAFASLDLTGFLAKLQPIHQALTLLGPATQQAVAQMAAAFTTIDLSGFLAALQPIHQVLVTLGPATQQAVAQMVAAFVAGTNQMITALQGVQNMAIQTGSTMLTIGTQATTAAGQVNAATNTMITALQGVQNMAAQTAGSFAQIGEAANSAAQVVNSATNTMITALQGVISQAEAVASAIEGIGAAADSARASVEDLAAAINSLQDRTITITTRYVTTGTPPAGGAGGIGVYGGTTYLPMAGGSAGIGGQGFAPLVIDHPTKLLVGESGPELVSVTPLNRNRNSRTGEISPFANMRMQGGSIETETGQGFTITTQSVVFDQNQGPIQIIQSGGGGLQPGGAGLPTTGGGFGNTNVPLGTGQGGTFNVPGGQVSVSGNAVACVNGQCFGNMQGFGPALGSPTTTPGGITGQQQQPFQPVFDENGMIKAIETLVEWFKYLGLPTGASVPGTGNFSNIGTPGTVSRGAFAQAGAQGAFSGQIQMSGGQIVFDSNQGNMELQTSTGAISIAGQGGAFAQAGNAIASAGNVSLFGAQENSQLTQINRTLENVSGSLQAVGNSMASLGDQIVVGNQQTQQTFQGLTTGLEGLQTTTQQGLQNVVNGVNLFGAGNQVGFQSFPGGGAVGAGGAAGNPLGFLNSMLGGFGIANPFANVTPTTGAPATGGTGTGGTIGTGTGGCSVCGAASGLQGAATDLSGAAGQLGNAVGQIPTGSNNYGTPTTGGGFPASGNLGGTGTIPTTGGGGTNNGPDCQCSCMPMDSDPNRFKIEDPSGRDCVNHQYFDSMAECESRLNEVKAGCGTPSSSPTPTPTPTTPTQQPSLGGGNVSAMANGGMAMASAGGVTAIAGGPMTGGIGQPVLGGIGMPIGNPPVPPSIVRSAGLPSQHIDVNQDPSSWRIIESKGLVGTYDIVDDSGDVVMLGFRTLSAAQEYLNYFISYYKWVKSGSNGIIGKGVQQQNIGGAFASAGGGGNLGGIPSGNIGGGVQFPGTGIGTGGNLGGGAPATTPQQPAPTPPTINILEPESTTPTSTTADKVKAANVDASAWKIAEATRPDGVKVYFVVVTIQGELTYVTETPFVSQADAQRYIDYYKQLQQYLANPPQQFPPPGSIPQGPGQQAPPTTGGVGGQIPGINVGVGGGITAQAGNAMASAGGGGAFAQAGNAIAQAGSLLGQGLGFGSGKKLGPTPVPDMPFEEIPRAQGPFRSGQDNQEPIYDNSRVKMGADVYGPGDIVTLEDIEGGGGGKKPRKGSSRIRDILQRHLNARVGVGGEYGELANAIISAIMKGFENIGITFPVNVDLDGQSIYKSQKKYIGKEVGLFV